MLVLARTPPGWSFKNPAERIMSQLNLALQSVGIMRTRAEAEWESKITKCNSMKELRSAAENYGPDFIDAFSQSIAAPKELLTRLFSQLQWSDKSVEVCFIKIQR